MNKDQDVIVERVANGFVLRPHYPYGKDVVIATDSYRESVFVFETFESLVKHLDEHFTKPVESKADG